MGLACETAVQRPPRSAAVACGIAALGDRAGSADLAHPARLCANARSRNRVGAEGTTAMEPLQVVQDFGAAWADHDLDRALELVTEDCVFDNTAPAPDGTLHVGRDALRRAWQPIFDD